MFVTSGVVEVKSSSFVCEQHYSKSCKQIYMKCLATQLRLVTRNNWLDFWNDLDWNPDQETFSPVCSTLCQVVLLYCYLIGVPLSAVSIVGLSDAPDVKLYIVSQFNAAKYKSSCQSINQSIKNLKHAICRPK